MENKHCFCGNKMSFKMCCEPYIKRIKTPLTAEQLMRARYSAFVTKNSLYIKETMKQPALSHFDQNFIDNSPIIWLKCEVIKVIKGLSKDNYGEIELKAHYKNYPTDPETHVLSEQSMFKKETDVWYYVDGTIIN